MDRDDADNGAADDLNSKMPNHDARTINCRKPLLFYKLMVASIVDDDKLKIPGKVVKRIEQELSIVVTVSVPDGRKWNMKLEKDGSKCWFGDGWVEFMKYYNVKVGYLLVFRYKGDSKFVVNIFNLSDAEIQYLPDSVGGSSTREEKHCFVNKKATQCGNVDTQKKFYSVAVKEDKTFLLGLPAIGKKSENEGKMKLDSAQVYVDELCLGITGTKSGNDATQGFTAGPSQTQNMSSIISGLLQAKLAELPAEFLSQMKNAKGGFEEIQQERQCSLKENDKLGTDSSMNRLVPYMIGHGKQCSMNKNMESVNDITLTKLAFGNIEDENLCLVTRQTESSNNDTQKKSDSAMPPAGFVKPAKQTTGNEKGASSFGGVENETKPSDGDGSPSSFLLVKDVTPGYYRANITSLEKKKPKMRKRKIPPTATAGNDGSVLIADTLNSPGKMELTPHIHLSKTVINVPTANSLTSAARSSAISQTGTIADGNDKKCQEPEKLYSETQVPKMIKNKLLLPARELSLQTPEKRRIEESIVNPLNNTDPIKVSAEWKVDVSQADPLDFTLEKTGKAQKKQKTIQLSAISNAPINPLCMVPMRASYVQKKAMLNIPVNFSSKYLQETSGFAKLQNVEGKQWTVRLISPSQGRVKFSQGWYQFAMDNYLKEDDMCIFELLDSVNTLLKVSFIRSPKVPPPADNEVLKL